MNINASTVHFIPITHILLACTIASITTAVFIFYHHPIMPIVIYILLATLFLITKKHTQNLILIICALFSAQIFFKINTLEKSYNSYKNFLQIPTIIDAKIIQKQDSELDRDRTTLVLETSSIYNKQQGKISNPLKILVILPTKKSKNLLAGQTITIFQAKLEQPKQDSDYKAYLVKEGIWATVFITNQNIKTKESYFDSWLTRSSTLFLSSLETSTVNLFNPLFLGKREKTLDTVEIQHQSAYWGIAHHMARSGLHLATLFTMFMLFFHYIRINVLLRYIICAILIFGYAQISVASISFLRALCMIMIQIFCKLNKGQYSSVHALTLTTLLFVANNPYCILFLDFQLSFGITAVIIWLFQRKYSKIVAFQSKSLIPS